MDGYEFAWLVYVLSSLGCSVAAWLLFRRFGREWSHFSVVSVLALLLTPYAINADEMIMAPALFIIVLDGIAYGIDEIKPVIMVLLGVWLVGLVLSLLLQLATRRYVGGKKRSVYQPLPAARAQNYGPEYVESKYVEPSLHDEVLDGEVPLRAIR